MASATDDLLQDITDTHFSQALQLFASKPVNVLMALPPIDALPSARSGQAFLRAPSVHEPLTESSAIIERLQRKARASAEGKAIDIGHEQDKITQLCTLALQNRLRSLIEQLLVIKQQRLDSRQEDYKNTTISKPRRFLDEVKKLEEARMSHSEVTRQRKYTRKQTKQPEPTPVPAPSHFMDDDEDEDDAYAAALIDQSQTQSAPAPAPAIRPILRAGPHIKNHDLRYTNHNEVVVEDLLAFMEIDKHLCQSNILMQWQQKQQTL